MTDPADNLEPLSQQQGPIRKTRRRMMPAGQVSAILSACSTVARLQEQVERGGLTEVAELTQDLASKLNMEAARLLGVPGGTK